MEMLPDVAADAGIIGKMDIMTRLKAADVSIYTNTRLARIRKEGIVVEDLKKKKTLNMDADRVVICLGVRSDNVLYREIKNSFDTVFLIGDAVVPRRIGDAIREGYEKAVLLCRSDR